MRKCVRYKYTSTNKKEYIPTSILYKLPSILDLEHEVCLGTSIKGNTLKIHPMIIIAPFYVKHRNNSKNSFGYLDKPFQMVLEFV